MMNFEMGKKIAAGGFFIVVIEAILELFVNVFSIYSFYSITEFLYYAGIFISTVGFLIMYIVGRNPLDFLTAAGIGLMLILKLFFISAVYSLLPTLVINILFSLFYVPMLLNSKKIGNAAISFLMLCAFVYSVVGVFIVRWIFFELFTWYMFGTLILIAGGVISNGICLLYCLNQKVN